MSFRDDSRSLAAGQLSLEDALHSLNDAPPSERSGLPSVGEWSPSLGDAASSSRDPFPSLGDAPLSSGCIGLWFSETCGAPFHLVDRDVGFFLGAIDRGRRAGEGFVDLPGEPHRFRNPDPTRPLRFVVAGSFRKDEPALQPQSGPADFPVASERGSSSEAPPEPRSAEAKLTEVKRTVLAQSPIANMPGMESRLYLIEFPSAAESKVHVHTTQGIGYVLEGSFESAFGDGPVTTTRAGEGFVDLPGQPHHFRNPDATRPLRFVVAGTYHKDEPLFHVLGPEEKPKGS